MAPTATRSGIWRAFTLIELLVVISIIAVLVTISLAGLTKVKSMAQGAYCSNSLHQLGAATSMYLAENQQVFFQYMQAAPGGRLWYFGYESGASAGSGEGNRTLDVTQSPLYPYVHQVGGVEVCPSFPYGTALWKPKYKGASWGYGYNNLLSGVNALTLTQPAHIIVFGDCAQVNTFQSPASSKNPMVEEFYMIDSTEYTVHFRHGTHANLLFVDGHVESMPMARGTKDTRLPDANIGRITPVGSLDYLQ